MTEEQKDISIPLLIEVAIATALILIVILKLNGFEEKKEIFVDTNPAPINSINENRWSVYEATPCCYPPECKGLYPDNPPNCTCIYPVRCEVING